MDADLVLRICNNQKHLAPALDYYLKQVKFNPNGNKNVLDIGCGDMCVGEFIALSKFYRENFGLQLNFVGVDINKHEYNRAQKALEEVSTFIEGDAQNIQDLVQEEFGLVVIRHPDAEVEKRRNVWDNILKNTKNVLSDNGVVLMTHFSDFGYTNLIALLVDNGYRILTAEKSKCPGLAVDLEQSVPTAVRDGYIAIGSKRS